MRTTTPQFFSDRYLASPPLENIVKVVQICMLPGQTEAGYSVMSSRLVGGLPASRFNLDQAIKLFFMAVDTQLNLQPTSQQLGLIFLFDSTGLSLSHLTRMNLSSVKKYLTYVQEAMPVRLKSIHVVNTNSLVSYLIEFIRPFIRKEYFKYIHFYTPDKIKNVQDFIQENILPIDYGGTADSMDILYRNTLNQIKSNEEWFKFDETQRIKAEGNTKMEPEKTLTDNFRTLDLD
ncbi:hypothetical protein AAG570_011764 [Ranatra chinensis]|uniref:CRAL-TRIO domain-containing protein n=1 Tax=Ranatra chinensis TaxID=642074 RepID=A0ABD0YGV8_9HEMI